MSRRLYVYYRLPEGRLPELLPALRQQQQVCRQALPGLHAELLRRPEPRDGEVTLMETYHADAGVDTAMQQRIESAFKDLFERLALASPRHTEVFEPLP